MTRDLGNGGGDASRSEFKDGMGDFGRHKDDPSGAHDAHPLDLFSCNFVGSGVKVVRVDGGERGAMRLELPVSGPSEGRVASEVQVSQPDQHQETVGWDIALCGPDIARPFLVLPTATQNREWRTETRPSP